MANVTKDLGLATAYAYHKAGGGTLTEAEFEQKMVDITTAVDDAEAAKDDAVAAKNAAEASAQSVSQSAQQIATNTSDIADLKEDLNEYVLDRYTYVEPVNWLNEDALTDGELLANGTITTSTTRCYTDYVPVKQGDKVQIYRCDNFNPIYRRHICLFDSDKVVVSGGSDSAGSSAFTIPAGVAYVRVTFDKANLAYYLMLIRDGVRPTVYKAYFEPYNKLSEDFLTEESEAAVQAVINKTLKTTDLQNKYGCALAKKDLRQTVGLPETWYFESAVTPKTENIYVSAGADYTDKYNDKVTFLNTTAVTAYNGYVWFYNDELLMEIDAYRGPAGYGGGRNVVAENLQDCSLLAIGDSTVDHDTMTATLLSHFAEKGKTITLLGTLGDNSGTNKNEGRAGWKATDYLTNRQYDGVVNPFYNPSTQTFDFSYYMTNQGYTAPDFVVLQLGINDLYNNYTAQETTWNAIKTMIDSIRAYNSGIKIILNLPTTPNSDQNKHSNCLFLYRNAVLRYNNLAINNVAKDYTDATVRCSYCHLILDPATEIRDNVHPTYAGYQKMALEVVNQINCWQNGV